MIFLSTWAFGLLGLAGVIVALYFLRRREERRTVSALWLWRQEPEHPRSAFLFLWTNIGLLIVQLAALAALVFALAAPTLPQQFFGGGTLALILDSSASMQTRYDHAIKIATELIAQKRPRALTVIQAQHAPRLLVPWTENRDQAITLLQASHPTLQGNAQESSVLQLLRSQRALESYDDIFYISDHPPEGEVLAHMVTWVPVGEPHKNIAIVGFAARVLPQGAQGVALWASVENFSSEEMASTLRFFAEDTEIAHESIHLAPGERRAAEALAEQSIGGHFRAVLEVADDFPFDNVRYALLPTKPKRKILWLGERNFFLERALNIFAKAEITTLPPSEQLAPESYDFVVVYNAELRTVPAGRFFFINSPVEPIVQLAAAPGPAGALQLLQPSSPLVQNVRLEHLQIPTRRDVTFALPVQTVIASEGQPLLAVHRSGSLSFVWLGVDLRVSPLVLTPSFPILVGNVMRWLLAEEISRTEQFVSEEFPAPGFTEQGAINIDPTESREVELPREESESPRSLRVSDSRDSPTLQTALWHYGAWLALGLLIVELLLYDRKLLINPVSRRSRSEGGRSP